MSEQELISAFFEGFPQGIVVADLQHEIRCANAAARTRYAPKFGEIVGRNLLDCHNEHSKAMLKDIIARFENGEGEMQYAENERGKLFVGPLRNGSGELTGYYERHVPPQANI